MANGFTRSPKLIKGAFIHFTAPMLVPIPNIIIFQYNPETMTRTLAPWVPMEWSEDRNEQGGLKSRTLSAQQINQLAQPFDPQESFSLTLELDATDALENPTSHPVALIAGVADRISALELLCYPPEDGGVGGLLNVSVNVSVGAGGASLNPLTAGAVDVINRMEVPIVLFFWGPGRIVPVRVTSFSVEEQQYSTLLYPVRAKVTLGLRVLDKDDLVNAAGAAGPNSASIDIAKACYDFTRGQKKVLALTNLLNSVESIGLLPT